MDRISQPRLLIISNNCLSLSNSNGRTIYNLLASYPKESIANFYVRDEKSDIDGLSHFFRVTDEEAYKSFKTRRPADGLIKSDVGSSHNNQPISSHNQRKNPLFSIARDIIWNSEAWKGEHFAKWLDDFNPEAILLQGGDAPFLFRLSRKIAIKRGIPLIIHNSEDYCFKKYNYMSHRFGVVYPLFHMRLYRQVKKAIKACSLCIYNSEMLKNEYQNHFNHTAEVLMMSSVFSQKKSTPRTKVDSVRIVYLGNLSVGRHRSLIDIASVLHKRHLQLEIYGRGSQEVLEELSKANGIVYCGVVDYRKVQEIISESNLIIHAESFDDYSIKDLRFAFSTKIADSLASGIPFFLYAPNELACTQYLVPLIPDFVATNHDDMVRKISDFVDGKSFYPWDEKVFPVVTKNHSIDKNQEKFIKMVKNAIKERRKNI